MNWGASELHAAIAFCCVALDLGPNALPPCFVKQSVNFFIAAEPIALPPLPSAPSLPSSPNPRPAPPDIAGFGAVAAPPPFESDRPLANTHTVFPERTFAQT